ncbi:MAG: HPr(Ser) kinase/phosphatase [Thiohalomonadales bacterium]
MSKIFTAQRLYKDFKTRLSLSWATTKNEDKRYESIVAPENQQRSLIGHLNLIRPNYIQVIGQSELDYLMSLGKNSRQDAIATLLIHTPVIVILADSISEIPGLTNNANISGTPILKSIENSINIIDSIQYDYSGIFSGHINMHGVFMEVMGIGVLLTGESNIGKSELALALISRGHRLIADDSPEFLRDAPDVITGTCPAVLKDFLEVRGLGILNIRAMYGDNSIVAYKRLRLIIHLAELTISESQEIDRLGSKPHSITILNVEIPKTVIPVAPGRHLAVIVEAAVRNQVLIMNGYDASSDFIQRQQNIILNKN